MGLRRRVVMNIVVWMSLILFTAISAPDKLPVVILIVPFVLLFMGCYGLWGILQDVRVRYFSGSRSSRRLGVAVCLSVVLLIVLQSVGQLALRDVITVAAIVVIGYLYVGRLTIIKHPD
jgi:hypothetical protein